MGLNGLFVLADLGRSAPRRMMLLSLVPILGPAFSDGAVAECAPDRLVRIETQDVSPHVLTGSTPREPLVTYRLGNGRARLEEGPNPETGLHRLVVTNAPNVWVVDLNSRTGEHGIDPDKPSKVRLPLFADFDVPPDVSALELGCETEFISRIATAHDRVETPNGVGVKHSLRSGRWKVALVTRENENLPMAAFLSLDEKVVQAIRYRSYQVLESVPDGLFDPPPDIVFERIL